MRILIIKKKHWNKTIKNWINSYKNLDKASSGDVINNSIKLKKINNLIYNTGKSYKILWLF